MNAGTVELGIGPLTIVWDNPGAFLATIALIVLLAIAGWHD